MDTSADGDADEVAKVKALRKAKKKEIQAWTTAFEEREGRSPESRDKEAIRSMYRDFKDLDSKLAALSQPGDEQQQQSVGREDTGTSVASGTEAHLTVNKVTGEVTSMMQSGSAASGVSEGRGDNTPALGIGEKAGEVNAQLRVLKNERDARKQEIKLWIKEFEEREGRSPTNEDKAPIKDLYRKFKDIEKQLANSVTDESFSAENREATEGGEAARLGGGLNGGASVDPEDVKAQKHKVKREIQAWLDDFEAREGRPALAADKTAIRPLFKRNKDLERELARLAGQGSPGRSGASTSEPTPPGPQDTNEGEHDDAGTTTILSPTSPQDTKQEYGDAETAMVLNPASSEVGEVVETERKQTLEQEAGGDDPATQPAAATDGLLGQETTATPLLTESVDVATKTDDAEGGGASAERSDGGDNTDGVGAADGDGIATIDDDDEKKVTQAAAAGAGWEGGEESITDERGSSRGSRRADGFASAVLSPVPSERSVIQNHDDGGAAGDHVDPDSQQATGTGDDNSDGNEEKQIDDEASGTGEARGVPTQGEVPEVSLSEEGAAAEGAEEGGPTWDAAGVTVEKRILVPSPLVIDSAADAKIAEEDNVPLTAQEARVRRMRARFLSMKSLLVEEEGGLASPTAAAPTNALWTSVNEAVFRGKEGEEERGGESSSGKGAAATFGGGRSRWGILGDAIVPNRKMLSPIARSRLPLTATAPSESGPRPQSSESKSQGGYDPTVGAEQGEGNSSAEKLSPESAPLADDGVSAAWVTGQMAKLLLSDAPPPPPPPPKGLDELQAEAARLRSVVDPPPPEYLAEYAAGIRGAELVVASVDVEEVEARERKLELERLADAREEANVYRAREANLLYREDRARRRVTVLEAAANKGVKQEKEAVIEISIARERALAPAFARARAGLETAIRAQAGRVREVFGELRPGETVAGRRFRVDWKGVPQPVEIRLHCIRAVRDRLPRGSYVVLSSMAERLGGRAMRWRKGDGFDDFDDEDSVDTGGDVTRPSCTLPVRHGGRYFDRELRLDQNVYQVCPSKADVRPGNVMVFEVFRLAGSGGGGGGGGAQGSNRHKGGELDEDTAVGWCVLPLADSRLRVVRGSFRIPLLRGEPNPNIDLHESLETLVAADLETWLGNLYLDVRHLPREARLDGVGVDGGSSIGGEGYDIEYDHVRKVVRLGKGLMGSLATANGRWKRLRDAKKDDLGRSSVNDGAEGIPSLEDHDAVKDETGGRPPEEDATDLEAGQGAGPPADTARGADVGVKENIAASSAADEKTNVGETKTATGSGDKDAVLNGAQSNIFKDVVARATDKGRGATAGSKEKQGWSSLLSRRKINSGLKTATDSGEDQGGSENGQAGEPQPGGRDREDISGAAGGAEGTTNERDPSPSAVEASSPDGGWAEILAPVRPAARGANGGDDGINADKTLDEECLSDDDVYRGSRFNFTPAGEAAHAVDTAAGVVASDGGYARGVGLRRRGEGARWDSAALGTGRRGLPKRYGRGVGGGNAAGNGRDSHVWTRLTNPAEMEYYRFAVAADPGTDAPPTPAQVIRHKLRYIRQEVILDLHPRGWRMMEYWLAVMVSLGALWLRVYLHALGQWFLLYAIGVPVFSFSPRLWEFAIKYMDRSSSLGVEIAFVSWGPTFVTLCFAIFAALARLWSAAACGGKGGGGGGGLPESFSRFVAAFGVGAILDPCLLFVIDIMAGNHDCSSKCPDYTAPSCRCHEGDAWKLYVRLEAEEGAGISGIILIVMIYFMISMVTALFLHQYLLHAHMNGRMLDVWRRLNAGEDEFFVPHDLEVSAAELQHACVRSRSWRGPGGARREVVLHDFHVNEETPEVPATATPRGGDTRAATRHKGTMTTHVAIYDLTVDGKKSLHRQFLRTADGTILEIFGEAGREVGWQLRSSLNDLMQQESGSSAGAAAADGKDQGIFAGMLPEAAPPVVPADAPLADGSGRVSDSGDTSRDIEAAPESNL